jgi:hypothetical protein
VAVLFICPAMMVAGVVVDAGCCWRAVDLFLFDSEPVLLLLLHLDCHLFSIN